MVLIGVFSAHLFAVEITDVRHSYRPEKTRLVLDFTAPVEVFYNRYGQDVEIYIENITNPFTALPALPQTSSSKMQWQNNSLTLLISLNDNASLKYFKIANPDRLVIDLYDSTHEGLQILGDTSNNIMSEDEPVNEKTIDTELSDIVATLDRDTARSILAERIAELTNAVVQQKSVPDDAREKLVAYRNVLSDVLAGRGYDEVILREALGLSEKPSLSNVLVENSLEVTVIDGDEKPYVTDEPFTPVEQTQPENTFEPTETFTEIEISEEQLEINDVNPSESDFTEKAATEFLIATESKSIVTVEINFEMINGIKRPILTDDMVIDFNNPLNPLELLFEAEKQLLIADLEAQENAKLVNEGIEN